MITQLHLDNKALEEQLVNTKTQLKEARGNKQENAPITPCTGPMSDDRHIPSLKTMLHLCEKRLEEANELADRRLDLHVTDLKNEHQREIRALKARHQFQMNSIDNWEEKHDAYEKRINQQVELTSQNSWLKEQLEVLKVQTGIQDLQRGLKLDPRNYVESIRRLCEQVK